MIRVWGRTNSVNVQKVMWTVAELGLDHERIDAGGAFGGLDSAAYGALNPNRRVPVLEDGGVVVWESNACVRYLAARYGRDSLWPEAPAARAAADMWMDWQISTLHEPMRDLFWGLIRTPPERRDGAALARAEAALLPLWQMVDAHLAAQPFMAGAALTIGDIPLGAFCHRYFALPIARPAMPALEAWRARLAERTAFRTYVMLPLS
jgi:glutathione S-transferase